LDHRLRLIVSIVSITGEARNILRVSASPRLRVNRKTLGRAIAWIGFAKVAVTVIP
jgi:hypothetical protein